MLRVPTTEVFVITLIVVTQCFKLDLSFQIDGFVSDRPRSIADALLIVLVGVLFVIFCVATPPVLDFDLSLEVGTILILNGLIDGLEGVVCFGDVLDDFELF